MAIPTSTTPPSTHLSDPLLPFLAHDFTPAAYLNATLPPLHLTTTPTASRRDSSLPLADLSTRTQTLLSQLNAQATRLSTLLNQLTDEILRSGGRLSYEVDVLRGEVLALGESLHETVKVDVEVFVDEIPARAGGEAVGENPSASPEASVAREPAALSNLRTLTHVRSQLDAVIALFGAALSFHLPPSLLQPQSASSFISVSAPPAAQGGGAEDPAALERRGQEYVANLRAELAELVKRDEEAGGGTRAGIEEARAKVAALRDLCAVWEGTAEEKARVKFVEGLAAFVEEKAKAGEAAEGRSGAGRIAGSPRKRAGTQTRREAEKGSGFLENLQRIRGAG